ncbi:MAG: STAS/SEC14 domain-containing protein [Gammaproteobacteria bacterium]
MVKQIPDLPDNVLGFAAQGTVTAEDYESTIIPAAEDLFSRHGKVRFLFHLGKEFSGFEAGAVWDDAKLGLKHFRGWEKIAVVSDLTWLRTTVKLFGFTIPAKVRVFANRELAEATRWVCK